MRYLVLRKQLIVLSLLLMALCAKAQTGSLTATFTPKDSRQKPVTISFTKPVFKYDYTHGYWFVNPHNGQRHFSLSPEMYKLTGMGIAYITLNGTDDDLDILTATSNDSDEITLRYNEWFVQAPKYDPKIADQIKPLHIHIKTFTNSEIAFTISGAATLANNTKEGEDPIPGTIKGEAHFYREPKYLQSELMPGCNCDPTIYASYYDEENDLRTTSACEAAFRNKLFDAMQKAMEPLFSRLSNHGARYAGDVNISILPGCVHVDVPARERPWCSSDYYHNPLTGVNAQKKIYSNDDGYGIRFIKTPTDNELNPGLSRPQVSDEERTRFFDSLTKLAVAHKISSDQYNKALQGFMNRMNGSAATPDLKKMEVEHNLYIRYVINAGNADETTLRFGDKNGTAVQHKIKGAAFEVFSPMAKDEDGNWVSNRLNIYIGKFSAPVMGKEAATTNALYPANANKLTVYNIIIRMEGSKELMEKAAANLDFSALEELVTKQ